MANFKVFCTNVMDSIHLMKSETLKYPMHGVISFPISNLLAWLSTATVFLWVIWRLWRFTIQPALHPDRPTPVPYLVPYVGNLFAMMKGSHKLYSNAVCRFKTSSIFSITVMGEELYIATSAADLAAIHKDTKHLDFNPIIRAILSEFKVSPETLDSLFHPRSSFNGRTWMDRQHDIFRSQMHPGSDRGDGLAAVLLRYIDDSMQWPFSEGPMAESLLSERGDDRVRAFEKVSLWKLCSCVLVEAATRAFWGDSLLRAAPDFVNDYLAFDAAYWAKNSKSISHAVRDRSLAALKRWLQLPSSERDDASWMIKGMERDFADLGIAAADSQLAAFYFLYHEVINANTFKSCFWLLAHVLFDEALRAELVDEMRPAIIEESENAKRMELRIDMDYLLESCPLLGSVYEETLRVSSDPTGIRVVTQRVKVGRTTLEPGRKLLVPYKQLHMDGAVFGDGVGRFDPARFLRNKQLSKSASFRPFGGGNGHCPGRFLARREVYMVVAILLFRFDVQVVAGSRMPVIDEKAPTGGILRPLRGHDVVLDIRLMKTV